MSQSLAEKLTDAGTEFIRTALHQFFEKDEILEEPVAVFFMPADRVKEPFGYICRTYLDPMVFEVVKHSKPSYVLSVKLKPHIHDDVAGFLGEVSMKEGNAHKEGTLDSGIDSGIKADDNTVSVSAADSGNS